MDINKLSPPSETALKRQNSSNSDLEGTTPSQRAKFILGEDDGDDQKVVAHDIFCEMEELREIGHGDNKDLVWRETARWVKFEEDVAEEGDRWSKPHVATLSLHSLFELRKGLMTGSVLLDLDADNLSMIFDVVLEDLVQRRQLSVSSADMVHELLMKQHRHQYDHKKSHSKRPNTKSLSAKGSKAESTDTLDSHTPTNGSFLDLPRNYSRSKISHSDSGVSLNKSDSHHKFNAHFAKKIPEGAQAANILVGETEHLSSVVMAYIRLSEGRMLGHLTEVEVPTRFIFILLGPKGQHKKNREIGRAIATLMCDEIFHRISYHARDREDLLTGIDEFLDQVTVLPPGEWDPKIKIEPPKSIPSQEGRKIPSHDLNKAITNGEIPAKKEEVEVEEDHSDPTLIRTGRFFGGLIQDIKRKAPFYLSDFRDALQVQCIPATIFMYFACLAPIVTFGGLLGDATENYMGAMESLVSGMVCGISYHMFAGQPLTIIGSTGPVLVFETIVYAFCQDNGLNYLGLRFWIGVWVFVILMIMVAFDLSALVRYITRFTEEAFASLIALIFIVEAFKKLFHILDERPVNMDLDTPLDYNCTCYPSNQTDIYNESQLIELEMYGESHHITLEERCKEDHHGYPVGSGCHTTIYYPDVFFFSFVIFFFTFAIAFTLKAFRNSPFFPSKVRSMVSDFSVIIAIVIMLIVDICVGFETPKLLVPESFQPTRADRTWVVNPAANPVWSVFAAIGFALLATILIFMDQQITSVIINRKEHKLKKGNGYHLDLALIALQILACSFLGTPWFVAATVLSINHVRSLTVESECAAPGEKPKFLGVREQRVTGTVAFILVGVSVLMGKALKYIPMPVLYGVFLYMGVASLNGLQMMQRIIIIFMPAKYQPNYPFLEHVPLRRVHLFTLIQVVCLAILWVIKSITVISIIFPLMVLAICFIRKLLDWVFTRHELKWLDDIMPMSHRQKKKKEKLKEQQRLKALAEEKGLEHDANTEFTDGYVNIAMQQDEAMSVAVENIYYNLDRDEGLQKETHDRQISNELNISEEMDKTTIWKQLIASELETGFTVVKRKSSTEENRIALGMEGTAL